MGSPLLYAGFTLFVLAMLALDLGVFHRKAHEVSFREAAIWSAVWVALAALFGVGVTIFAGSERGLEFATGYVIEKSLSMDNVFVIALLFSAFAIPNRYQHRVLFWGILGALVMRGLFIGLGAAAVARFTWILYVFGGFLVITGVKLLVKRDDDGDPSQNVFVRTFRRVVPTTTELHEDKFIVTKHGRRFATPLLVCLVAVEATDLIFAVDSIPAIFAVTKDPFLVFTSNIFAILGLRSLYFLLAGLVAKFRYLKVGLSAVLVFVGAKLLLLDVYKIPIAVSLAVIAVAIGGAVAASLWAARREELGQPLGAGDRRGVVAPALDPEISG